MKSDELVKITREDSYEKRWILVGTEGAVDFHVSHAIAQFAYLGRTGGIEEHHRSRVPYMDEKPSHDNCWILNGPCWHDGSSLYASEVLIPIFESGGESAIWIALRGEYISRFRSRQDEELPSVAPSAARPKEPKPK